MPRRWRDRAVNRVSITTQEPTMPITDDISTDAIPTPEPAAQEIATQADDAPTSDPSISAVNDPAGILDPSITFKSEALRAMREFRRSKPWRGTLKERSEKFRTLNAGLAAAYEMPTPELILPELEGPDSDGAFRMLPGGIPGIILVGKLSVVTFLRLFAKARGLRRTDVRWAVNLFRRVFPRSFARCRVEADGRVLRSVPRLHVSSQNEIGAPYFTREELGLPSLAERRQQSGPLVRRMTLPPEIAEAFRNHESQH